MINIIIECLNKHTDTKKYSHIVSVNTLADALINSDNVAKYLGFSASKFSNLNKIAFPNKPKRGKTLYYLLSLSSLKLCPKCRTIKPYSEFRANSSTFDQLNSWCKPCHSSETSNTQAYRQAKYRCIKLQATPKWANLDIIRDFYTGCPEGFHVDHIIPLQGKNICGLHVENNLQYLSEKDNLKKSNKF